MASSCFHIFIKSYSWVSHRVTILKFCNSFCTSRMHTYRMKRFFIRKFPIGYFTRITTSPAGYNTYEVPAFMSYMKIKDFYFYGFSRSANKLLVLRISGVFFFFQIIKICTKIVWNSNSLGKI